MAAELREKADINGKIALSETVNNIQDTHNAFHLVRHLLRLHGNVPEGEILQKEDIDLFSFPVEFLDFSRLYELLIRGDEENAVTFINNIFYEVCKREFVDENDIQQIFFLCRRILIQTVNDMALDIEKKAVIPAYDSGEDVSSLFADIAESIRKICAAVISRHDEQTAEFEQSVIKYVDDNVTNPNLYARMVTDNFKIIENRLQMIFRRWTGKSFLKYVESKRMILARETILTTNKPIAQICRDCGYSTEDAFYKAFRRHFGTAPGNLRH
jgi:YesN/AraC family two-component response regulator